MTIANAVIILKQYNHIDTTIANLMNTENRLKTHIKF